MNLRKSAILLLLTVSTTILAQKTQNLTQIYTSTPISVRNPLMVDSVSLTGSKFTEKELLKMNVSFPDQASFVRPLKADNDGYFYPEKPQENSTFQLLSFYVSSDRYAKGKLKVTSPNMLELYIDGKLVTSKTTKENNHLNSEKDATADISPYPLTNRVVIKLLSSSDDKAHTAVKITLENDSLSVFTVSNNKKRFVNFTDMVLGNRVTNTKTSPNGNYALLYYRNTFGEKSISTAKIYNLSTGKQITIDTDGSKKQLNWMPQSEKLYYVQQTDGGTNLITIDPSTLEETVLIKNIPNEHVIFAPNEKSFFYTKQEKGEENKSDLKLMKSPEDRQPGYTDRSFIHRYDIYSGLSQQLTYGSHTTRINDISFDSNQILFSTTDETVSERPFRKHSMYKLNLTTMETETLWTNEGFAQKASFSPDAKQILALGSGEAFGGIGLNVDEGQIANMFNGLAFIMDVDTKKIESITKDFNPAIEQANWNGADNLIYFHTADEDYVNIYTYNPSNKTFKKLPLEEDVIRTFSYARNGSMVTYAGGSLSNSTRVYTFDLKKQKSTLIADPYNETLSELQLGEAKDWSFTSTAGTTIKGSYFLPPDFDTSKKYPMIVYYYGGTSPTTRTFEGPYPAHVFAAQGYVVYVIQPSGAFGFGQKFAALHVNSWGKRTAEDIMEGTEQFVKEHSFIDAGKIGCIGASYGGFMTMYLQTKTDMFAAAVSHAGISSISSYWGEGYWGYTYSSGASAHSYPWNNHDLYVKQSPLFSADKINTPILFTHGAVDTNVPIGESIQMYTALKILGKEAEFIQVKDENHGIAQYKRRVEWNNSIMAWFAKWLKNDGDWWNGLYPNK